MSSLGKKKEAAEYEKRAKAYRNVWCDSVQWFRARVKGGGWLPWRGRTAQDQGTTESNPFQQGWFVPHDIDGMKALMGGQKKFDAE